MTDEEFAAAKARILSPPPPGASFPRGIRRQSSHTFCGLPWWAVAVGPDLASGELRGHARGIFAVGDIATGWLACGGLARGFVAIGGFAIGWLALGGCALGGMAIGGAALGGVAIGGGACGYYALGGAAAGAHTISAGHQDPAALDFFKDFFPWIPRGPHR